MTGKLLQAGKDWMEARIALQPVPRGERVYALVGVDRAALEAQSLTRLGRNRASRAIEVIPARHVAVDGSKATLKVFLSLVGLMPEPKLVLLRHFDAAGKGTTLFTSTLRDVSGGGFTLVVEHQRTVLVARPSVLLGGLPRVTLDRGVVVGSGLCAAWKLAQRCGGVRLRSRAVQPGQQLGVVVAQSGKHSQTVVEVATRDSKQLQLLGVRTPTVQRMARASRPVRTLAELAFLSQAGYRDLGMRASLAKRHSRDALLMLFVTGVSEQGAVHARLIRLALKWESRNRLPELVGQSSLSAFDRELRRIATQLRNQGENVPRLSRNDVSLWWTKISELLP